jgi:hypothetical protein
MLILKIWSGWCLFGFFSKLFPLFLYDTLCKEATTDSPHQGSRCAPTLTVYYLHKIIWHSSAWEIFVFFMYLLHNLCISISFICSLSYSLVLFSYFIAEIAPVFHLGAHSIVLHVLYMENRQHCSCTEPHYCT